MPNLPIFAGMTMIQTVPPAQPPSAQSIETRRERLAMWLQFPRRALFLLVAIFLLWMLVYLVAGIEVQREMVTERANFQIILDPALRQMSPEQRQQMIDEYVREYMDQPLALRYFLWLGDVLRGNLGLSSLFSRSVGDLITEHLHNTLLLCGSALLLTLPLTIAGIGLTLLAHWMEGRRGLPGSVLKGLGRLFIFPLAATPAFGLGLLLVLVFGLKPYTLGGAFGPGEGATSESVLQHLILPALALAWLPATLIAQTVACEATLPRARRGWRVWVGGLLRGLGTAQGLSGLWISLVIPVEIIFGFRQGIGWLAYMAIGRSDKGLLLGLVLACSLLVLAGQLLAEVYRWAERLIRLPPSSPLPEVTPWRKKAHKVYVVIALVLLVLPLLLGLLGLTVDPNVGRIRTATGEEFLPPSAAHPLGTDRYGRDQMALTLRGASASVMMALLVGISLLVPAAIGSILTGRLALRPDFWRESLADLMFLPGNIFLLVPSVLGAAFITFVLWPSLSAEQSWPTELFILALVLLPRAMRAGQALRLAAPTPRPPFLLILSGGGALFLGTIFAAFCLQAGVDFLGLGIVTPSLGSVLAEGVLGGYLYRGQGDLLVVPLVAQLIALGICATVFYTAADALIGYFQDKEALARLNE